MSVKATLRATELVVARITVDFLSNPVKIHALAAFVDQNGQTLAWSQGDGGVWSPETLDKLKALRDGMEQDLARALTTEGRGPTTSKSAVPDGLGELLGSIDAPSI